jgi:hypothetical protein
MCPSCYVRVMRGCGVHCGCCSLLLLLLLGWHWQQRGPRMAEVPEL